MSILGIIGALLVLMLMITIHELGHYTAGKIFKFRINEFSVGMGPKLWSRKKKDGEVVSLRAIPLGGYCAFEGENSQEDSDNASNDAKLYKTFNEHKAWQRLIVLFSGALFNIITAILLCVILFSCYGNTAVSVDEVYEYAPVQNQTLLQSGDIIHSVNGKVVYLAGTFSNYLSANETYDVVVLRNGEYVELSGLVKGDFSTVIVDYCKVNMYEVAGDSTSYKLSAGDTIYSLDDIILSHSGQYYNVIKDLQGKDVTMVVSTSMGETINFENVSIDKLFANLIIKEYNYSGIGMSIKYVNVDYTFGQSIANVMPYCWDVSTLLLRTLGGIFTGSVALDQVGGPVSTIVVSSQIVTSGLANILRLIILISLNLAVFNLLPIPALDGCKMLFVLIEMIARKPLDRKIENVVNFVGFIVLFGFIILMDLVWLL